jgi:hypothetical protein
VGRIGQRGGACGPLDLAADTAQDGDLVLGEAGSPHDPPQLAQDPLGIAGIQKTDTDEDALGVSKECVDQGFGRRLGGGGEGGSSRRDSEARRMAILWVRLSTGKAGLVGIRMARSARSR